MALDQLYQEKILALARTARNSTMPPGAVFSASVRNPACGDCVTVTASLDAQDCVDKIGAEIQGCALCEAGAGYLLALAPNRHRDEFKTLAERIEEWLKTGENDVISPAQEAFIPVRAFTSRHICVCLPFQAIVKALN